MKLFVSHALSDQNIINGIKTSLEPYGVTLFVAEHYTNLSGTITDKIEQMIKSCDVALILLTDDGFNSRFVQQEIGYIKSSNKALLQVVQIGLENQITGFTYGHDYLVHDPQNPEITLESIKLSLLTYWRQVEQDKLLHQQNLNRHFQSVKEENERQANEAKIAFAVLAGILVLGLSNR